VKITILGCGSSGGVPRVGGIWGKCDPANPKNRRRRVSILVEKGGTQLLVDTSPDLREQLLDAEVQALDGVLYTHDHADHTHGIDDLRGIFHMMKRPVDVFANKATLKVLKKCFDYIFEGREGYPATCVAHQIEVGKFCVAGMDIIAFEQAHGNVKSIGYRFDNIAYSTDVSGLADAAKEALQGLDVWIVDVLRYDPHPTHSHLAQTLEWIDELRPKRAILTHMSWQLDYETLRHHLPENVEPGYDGMVIEIPDSGTTGP
jgi:phosphoribosyl 1,2-cyclic phosphate phosphodiesterase